MRLRLADALMALVCFMVLSARASTAETCCVDQFNSLQTSMKANEESCEARLAKLEEKLEMYIGIFEYALDHIWLLICGSMVFVMQVGFAMLEVGAIGGVDVLVKNVTDVCLSTFCWWSFGWMMAYGADHEDPSTNFAGNKNFFTVGFYSVSEDGVHSLTQPDLKRSLNWFFQWAFCGAAATIVSGGVSPRMSLHAHIIYTICMTTFIYPIVVYWTWSEYGFLRGEDAIFDVAYHDFAGSSVVHVVGGVGAGIGAALVGPRKGRFPESDADEDQDSVDQNQTSAEEAGEFLPINIANIVLGTFLLWFGWYGFNCGSTLGLSKISEGQTAAHVAMNTTIAAGTGGLTVLLRQIIGALLTGKDSKIIDPGEMCNGILAGLVSITAGCNNVETHFAFLIAIIGSILYLSVARLVRLAKIDDPLDAFAIHAICGSWGVIAALFFDWGRSFKTYSGIEGLDCTKDKHDDSLCDQDAWSEAIKNQLFGLLCIWLWVCSWSLLIMGTLNHFDLLRHKDPASLYVGERKPPIIDQVGSREQRSGPSRPMATSSKSPRIESAPIGRTGL